VKVAGGVMNRPVMQAVVATTAAGARSLLQQPPRRVGFASGCPAFGHRQLLGVLRQFGLVLDPVVTEHR